METLAYLHVAVAYETDAATADIPGCENLKAFAQLNWKKLSGRASIHFLSLAVALAVLGIVSEALAQTVLRQGSRGAEVTELQERLRQQGYFRGSTTQYFGPKTKSAVTAFQRDNNLTPDGIVGSATNAALFGITGSRQRVTPSIGFNPPPPYIDFNRDRDLNFERDTDFTFNRDTDLDSNRNRRSNLDRERSISSLSGLQRGDSGTQVIKLQRQLRNRGYDPGPIDGIYGRLTEDAVREFQLSKGLPADGIADRETLQALGFGRSSTADLYAVIVPGKNFLGRVRQYAPRATTGNSRLGDYVNAGTFTNRNRAESLSELLRSYGLDARVVYSR